MGESRIENSVGGIRETRRRMGRRDFLKLTAGVGVVAAGAALARAPLIEGGKRLLEERPTAEQQIAARILKHAGPGDLVYNLVAVGEKDENGQIVRVKERRRPATMGARRRPSLKGSEAIGELPLGTRIDRAIVVWGNDPQFPTDADEYSRWLAFPDPVTGEVVFANENGFELDDANSQKLFKIDPDDIQGRLPKGPGLKISSR